MNLTIEQRAREIADFLGKPYDFCLARLRQGFGYLHGQVTQDWRNVNPQTDAEILEWYRNTEAYIWELSAYHLDPGFNYSGMMQGVSEALRAKGVRSVLCLGDGIGDLTMQLTRDGFEGVYHDLYRSRTHQFAASRFQMYGVQFNCLMNDGWAPELQRTAIGWDNLGPVPVKAELFDAIVSLDFLEHVTNVEEWVRAIFAALKPGGWLVAQNAFACGSGPDGSMPMHLACNDRFEKDWDPLLFGIGFVQECSNWYRKPL